MSDDLARYHRQMLLPGFGPAGQARLRGSTVLVLGCGALGCLVADLLARAGVGHLVIVDRDVVELTNLQRQLLFDEQDEAVKWMIRTVIEAAHRAGAKVGLCGQAPSDHPEFAEFLVECGIDSMSLSPDRFVAVKRRVAAAEARLRR